MGCRRLIELMVIVTMTAKGDGRPATKEVVGKRLRQIIQDNAGIPARLIRDNSSFDDVLAMSSLSAVSAQVSIEAEYEISISVDEFLAADTFDGLVCTVIAKVEARA
jgi:acyl carrier protein